MLFNSLLFLLVVLPLALTLYVTVEAVCPRLRTSVLLAFSFAFYAAWDVRFVPLLAASILLNWVCAERFLRARRDIWIVAAIVADLALLGLFKYLGFLADIVQAVAPIDLPHSDLALPLGISFFTFQHVMYLVDLRAGRAQRLGIVAYALFVAFFARVIAGPLTRPSEFALPDDDDCALRRRSERIARGWLLLIAGLAKKVLIGDPLGAFVGSIYAGAASGLAPSPAAAWQAMLGYTFQLYFDFSGYTDMALGLALMFGMVLPQNFDAPYRSVSIQDFWRRWHITLSRFLQRFLYVPMGGNRHGVPRQVLALLATMALGGLWHGAGFTFVAWGTLHGLALGANLLWRKAGLTLPSLAGGVLTFAFVALAWVLFRAPNFTAALAIYRALVGITDAAGGFSPGFWPLTLAAALIAVIGPTALTLTRALRPTIPTAILAALLFAVAVLKTGDDANLEFIYAQF